MQRKVAWVNPENAKAGKAIGVALNDTACRVLRDQIGKSSRWVFVHTKPSTRPDKTVTPAVRKMRVDDNSAWRIGLAKAGIEDFRFHDLRHTYASTLEELDVSAKKIQLLMGHASATFTMDTYIHKTETMMDGIKEKLENRNKPKKRLVVKK